MAHMAARFTAPLELVSAQPHSPRATSNIRPTMLFISYPFPASVKTAATAVISTGRLR